jgi:phage-related protein
MSPATWRVEFYQDARDGVPVLEFINELQKQEQAAVLRTIDLLQEFGPMLGMPHVRQVDKGMWELRAGAGRVFYFAATGRRFILLHGYRKRGQKAPQREIDTAWRRWADWMEREQ